MNMRLASVGLLLLGGPWYNGGAAAQAEMPTIGAEGARYDHRVESSRFDPGANVRRQVDGPYERIVGDRGVFLIDRVTGATLAVPSARLDVPKPKPKGTPISDFYPRGRTKNPDDHNAEVRTYLLSAGVPEAEVSGMHVTTTMAGGGPTNQGVQTSRSRLLWYTTHLERSLGGVPVESSYAFAALDSDGKVITEGVYWPPISENVVRRARGLQQKLATAEGRAAFLENVKRVSPEVGNEDGAVSIVHTSGGYHGEFQANALFSVIVRHPEGGKARIIRFDDTGSPMRMADELPSGVDSGKSEHKKNKRPVPSTRKAQ